ncbi:MAG: PRC-barrel domain-containing protein [Actinobacteria bacterium]|nr:PRC-barrel domain-containing protein [Actinomycetota bacterium]
MEESDHRAQNPYTEMEGYTVYDASGEKIGEVEETVYDAPSDVLKYVIVGGHPIPAESIDVDPSQESVSLPHDRETVESAPEMEELSGAFDAAVREHYEGHTRNSP